jgi:hypothetical protein
MKKATRSVKVMVRFTPEEIKHIREIVKANTGTVSEFVRTCVNTQLAQAGDPKALEMLTAMFTKGMDHLVRVKIQAAIDEEKKKIAG